MRWHLGLAVGVGFVLAGCSQSALPPSARIIGTNGLVQVGDFLFVTSTDRAELRALDLKAKTRDFVRAPNPLEPLSIPVLDRPVALVRDLRYEAGQEVAGPYIYAQAEAAQEISIVGTDRTTQLVELARLPTLGIVTALAAQGGADGQPSTLYYATLSGTIGELWQVSIPAPDAAGRIRAPILPASHVEYVPGSLRGDPVTALLVMPDKRIVVASRNPTTKLGTTVVLDLSPNARQRQRTLNFPGAVRMLATQPAIDPEPLDAVGVDQCRDNDAHLSAGGRIFGVLDEETCLDNTSCGGIVAVDSSPISPRFGQISCDKTGNPMVPLRFGSALTTGLSLARAAPLVIPGDLPTFNLLGIISLSNGLVYFFDASALRYIDTGPTVQGGGARAREVAYRDATTPTPRLMTYVPGPKSEIIQVAHGAAIDETVRVTYEGTIPGLRNREFRIAGITNQLSVDPPSLVTRVMIRDRVTLINCTTETGLTETGVASVAPSGTLTLENRIQCTDPATYFVRAGARSAQPYVVEGTQLVDVSENPVPPLRPPSGNMTLSGYMGRTSDGATFDFPADPSQRAARYYYHPPTYDPMKPQLHFEMGPGDPTSPIQRDWSYELNIYSNFDPEYMFLDSSYGVEFHLPASSVYTGTLPSGGDPVNRIFVAYPSANAILEINPVSFAPNRANFRYVTAYR